VALAFLWAGYALCFFGGLWIVVLAWQDGILWGIGCFLFPLLQFVGDALNWKKSKSAFFILLAGFAALVVSNVIGR
jgi:hypothetical protein